jgi:hypothetical protein
MPSVPCPACISLGRAIDLVAAPGCLPSLPCLWRAVPRGQSSSAGWHRNGVRAFVESAARSAQQCRAALTARAAGPAGPAHRGPVLAEGHRPVPPVHQGAAEPARLCPLCFLSPRAPGVRAECLCACGLAPVWLEAAARPAPWQASAPRAAQLQHEPSAARQRCTAPARGHVHSGAAEAVSARHRRRARGPARCR